MGNLWEIYGKLVGCMPIQGMVVVWVGVGVGVGNGQGVLTWYTGSIKILVTTLIHSLHHLTRECPQFMTKFS